MFNYLKETLYIGERPSDLSKIEHIKNTLKANNEKKEKTNDTQSNFILRPEEIELLIENKNILTDNAIVYLVAASYKRNALFYSRVSLELDVETNTYRDDDIRAIITNNTQFVLNQKTLLDRDIDVTPFEHIEIIEGKNIDTFRDYHQEITDAFGDADGLSFQANIIVVSNSFIGGTLSLIEEVIKKYDTLDESNPLKVFFSTNPNKDLIKKDTFIPRNGSSLLLTPKQIAKTDSLHFGSFSSKDVLANSQREALHCCMQENLSLVAVNGGPGTGKTALLRAVFADYIVKASLKSFRAFKKDRTISFDTPLISTSENNKALTNVAQGIMEEFKKQAQTNNPLFARWLKHEILDETISVPNLKSKESQESLSKNSLISLRDQLINDSVRIGERFIEMFAQYKTFPSKNSSLEIQIEQAVNILANELLDNCKKLENSFISKEYSKDIEENIKKNYKLDEMRSYRLILENKESYTNIIKTLDSLEIQQKESELKIKDFESELKVLEIAKTEAETRISQSLHDTRALMLTKLSSLLEEQIGNVIKNSPFVTRFIYSLFAMGRIRNKVLELESNFASFKEELLKASTENLVKSIDRYNSFFNEELYREYHKAILELNSCSQKRATKESELLLENIKYKGILLNKENIEKEVRELAGGWSVNKFRNIVVMLISLENDTVLLNKQLKRNNDLDITIRNTNLFLGLHILEGLYILSLLQEEKREIKDISCPSCGKGTIWATTNGNYKCNNNDCGLVFVPSAEHNKVKKNQLPLWAIRRLLLGNTFSYSGVFVSLVFSGNFMNIRTSFTAEKEAKNESDDNILSNILPVFPMLNVTVTSFNGALGRNRGDGFNAGMFDLIVADEMGTSLSSKAFFLYTAKKVVLFGDEVQLEPIYPFGENADLFFSKTYLSGNLLEKYKSRFMVSSNSIIKIANDSIAINRVYDDIFQTEKLLNGDIWLKEHFRCAKDIISIANKTTYGGLLEPLKMENGRNHLVFVNHLSKYDSKTNTNIQEAKYLVEYIVNHKDEFLKTYTNKEKIAEIVGIITPFVNQEVLIRQELRNSGDSDLENISVGTVHKYQGSENEVILFSTVYNYGYKSKADNMFYNKQPFANMINVSTSRAKDLLITFGNIGLNDKPNTHMKAIIDATRENGIVVDLDSIVPVQKYSRILDGEQEHFEFLKRVSSAAKNEVIIVSPWLRQRGIEISEILKSSRAEKKSIFFGNKENDCKQLIEKAEQLTQKQIERLAEVSTIKELDQLIIEFFGIVSEDNRATLILKSLSFSAQINCTKNSHAKIAIIDNIAIVGSLNWFSANTDRYAKQEISYIIEDKGIIDELKTKIF